LAKKAGLKFIFGTEAYWVKDRLEKDKTNSHICLFAKSEKGRRDINRILSDANIDGYYYRPRIDLNLLSTVDPNEVFITSACLAFWHYEDIDDIVLDLHSYFGKNFMLEVQSHNTEPQRVLNQRILNISKQHGIDIIMGCDSHFIYPEQAQERDDVLEAKGIRYENEDGWYMDYPDGETVIKRFNEQGILNEEQLMRSIKNTELFLDFEDYDTDKVKVFSKDIKLPTLYPDLTQQERNKKYTDLLNKEWKEFKVTIPQENHKKYVEEIRKEGQIVLNTGMADYFLIDHEIVKRAVENGGVITTSGRGSGVSFITNTLLGFSKVDRIAAPVKLYPERFMSESRILESKSLPDLDLNLGNPEIFAQAQTEVLGEGHSYPMIAYGTFKIKSAFKMYAKSQNLDFEIANDISKQIEQYEMDLKYADEDEEDLINVYDYVDSKYHEIIKGSEPYTGIISDKKVHPCGYLIYQGNIKEEIGLLRIKSESTKKDVLAVLMDGDTAENYKFLKNDLLKVDVVQIIAQTYKRIGTPIHTESELLSVIKNNQKVWDVYANGFTVGVNQVEKTSTTQKIKRFKPQNISELTAFIAAIRPAFQSMYQVFESRKPFSYGISSFDDLIQTEEMPNSFVLYQEQTMAALQYAGFPSDHTYSIIKAISKKKPDVVRPLKEKFLKGFSEKIMDRESVSLEQAMEMSDQVWKIIEDSAGYGFNASHAYSYALDSVYCAYLKSHYPLYFYEVLLRYYSEKKKKDKVALLKQEMQIGFGIRDGGIKFRADNREFVASVNDQSIYSDLSGVKFMNKRVADEMYPLRDNAYESFTDVLIDIEEKTSIDSRQLTILITLDYFAEFGKNNELLQINSVFSSGKETYKKTHKDETKAKRAAIIKEKEQEIRNTLKNKDIPFYELIKFQKEYLGFATVKYPKAENYAVVLEIDTKYKPRIVFYNLQNGEEFTARIEKKRFYDYDQNPNLKVGDVIVISAREEKKRQKKTDSGYVELDETELHIKSWNKYIKE
jgi:DNA polymerase III alpha subunit